MKRFVAQFVGTDPNLEPIAAVNCTPNCAIDDLKAILRARLEAIKHPEIDMMLQTGVVSKNISYSNFERDACAVLYGSDDLRPHIALRLLPPHV